MAEDCWVVKQGWLAGLLCAGLAWTGLVGCGGGAAAVAPPADTAGSAADAAGLTADALWADQPDAGADSGLDPADASDPSDSGGDANSTVDADAACSACLHPQLTISDGTTLYSGQNVHISAAGSSSTCATPLVGWHFALLAPSQTEADEHDSAVPYLSVALQQLGTWQVCLRVEASDGALSCEAACASVEVIAAP